MRLLKEFQSQLSKFADLKRVWLTSFNINIEFIEKYVLPAVLDMEVPKTRMDYEALQAELNQSGIDFRVFCDKRFIELEGNKRTSIPIYGISPQTLGFSPDCIFHAKVIYLEGRKQDPRIIGSGSANLTLDGWARNLEVFHFEEVESYEMQDSIIHFFSYLFQEVEHDVKIIRRRGLPKKSNVRFCHSLQKTPFLEQLSSGVEVDEISVWSPYFPRDLAAFTKKLKQYFNAPNLKLNIVPDRVDGQYLRTEWTEEIEKLIKREEMCFFNSPVSADERTPLCHAKVWKTKAHMAIGSWNFTNAGSNISNPEGANFRRTSNVEAGFIIEDNSSIDSILGNPFKAGASAFATSEQMAKEILDVPKVLPFDLLITFHWSDLTYRFCGTWNDSRVGISTYNLILPGIEQSIPLIWKPRVKTLKVDSITVHRPDKLLAERKYEIQKGESIVGYGLIIEEDVQCRRPQQYEDLRGLLDAIIIGGDDDSGAPVSVEEDESGRVWVNGKLLHGDEPTNIVEIQKEDISFFRLFSASYQYASKLKNVSDMRELEHWVFMRPGCLEELVNKTVDKIGTSRKTTVFNWFLAKEVDGLVKLAHSCRNSFYKSEDDIPLSRWNALKISIPKLSQDANIEYREIIEKEYTRMHKTWGR